MEKRSRTNLLISKFLHREVSISPEVPRKYLFSFCLERFWMLFRGLFAWGFHKKGKRFFLGKFVHLKCRSLLQVGDCVTFKNGVFIDALSKNGVIIGNNVVFGPGTTLRASGSITALGKGVVIGDYSSFGDNCFLGAAGGIQIGSYVAMGQCVRFHSENHVFSDPNTPIHLQGVSHKGITIGNDCWIGAGAVFLDGSSIGNGCVVGADSVVTKAFPDGSVIAGVPARIIRMRTK